AADAGERSVTLTVADRFRQHFVPMLERLAGLAVAATLGRGDHGDQPGRCRGEVARRIDRPCIWTPARMDRGRRNDVAAVAANIETDTDLTDAIADLAIAGEEVVVPPLASDGLDRGRQSAVNALKLEQRTLAVLTVNIEHEDAAGGAGGDADVEIR